MQILLVKLSSLGDVIHNFPVATDIRRAFPHAIIDWATDATYASLVAMHPAIRRIVPIHLRSFKRKWWQPSRIAQLFDDKAALVRERYDLIIDTQGLIKSALVANWANGNIAGFDKQSIREPMATRYYRDQYAVSRKEHAVVRNRALAALALGYTHLTECDYGLSVADEKEQAQAYAVLLHATSRDDKTWPLASWVVLGRALNQAGFKVILPSGNPAEYVTSAQIAERLDNAQAINAMPLPYTATMLAQAKLVVGVDTGLTHLGAALNRPTVGIYRSTSPELTGLYAGANNAAVINLGGGSRQHAASVSCDDVLATISTLKLTT